MDSDDEVEVLYDDGDNSDDEFIGDDDISMEAITCGHQNQILGVKEEEEEEYSYEILSTEQIVQHMLDSVREVNTVVEIPSTITRILLHHFNWDKQKLMERYYDGDQDKLFAEARVVNPFETPRGKSARNSNSRPNSSNEREDCGICFVSEPVTKMSGLKCGHRFCSGCWNGYLTTKITEGSVRTISCPAQNCGILVDDVTAMRLLADPKVKLKYQQSITNSFVECNKFLRWCPSANCNHAIKVQSVEAKAVTCKCSSTFCFACGEAWHDPINCQMLRKWTKQCDDDSQTSSWMAKNTKDCPKCNTNIEKNEGCNYVVCSKCQQQFCWLCRHPTFNYSAHDCIKFKANEPSKEVLQKYLFYNYRYMNHRESLKLESELYAKVDEKMEEMQRQDMTWIEVQFLKKAVDVLRSCRRTLMYTYAFAFYLKKTNQTAIFEDNQKDLELAVETLSGYLERDIADENFNEIKLKVQDMLRYCESRRKVLLAHVHEGNDNDWWEFIKL